MSPEPTSEHKVRVVAGTYYGQPWLYLNCQGCKWRLGFAADCDPAEFAVAAESHRAAALRTGDQVEPMTGAEQAVVDVLEGESACTWHVGCDVEDCYGPRAAAIVAKLRPLLAAEALETAAADWENQPESVSMKPDVEAWLHRRVAALRTTTPEETR